MKKKLLAATLLSSLLLFGCSSKEAANNNLTATAGSSESAAKANVQNSQGSEAVTSSQNAEQRTEIKTDFSAVKPNTVPQLSSQQKVQINTKIGSILKSIDNTLNSLQDAPEINLNSIGN